MKRIFKRLLWCSVLCPAVVALGACTRPSNPYSQERDILTVFASTGQEETSINLTAETGSNCPFRIIGEPLSAELRGNRLILDHSQPIHEGIRVRLCAAPGDEPAIGVVWNVVQPESAPDWPLSVSDDGHYLVDSNSRAIFWNGGTAWSIAAETTRDEAKRYLTDRAAKGVNVVLASLIEHLYSDGDPPWRNVYGYEPFATYLADNIPDMSRPVEAYWRHVDWIIREAYANGITILAVPSYVGYQLGGSGWGKAMSLNGPERLRAYGEWLGQRYSNVPNIVWVMGGDWSASYEDLDISSEVDALAGGITYHAKGHLVTAHGEPESSARDDYDRPWLAINSIKSRTSVVELVSTHYERQPTLPTFFIEGNYGNERGMTEQQVRTQIYSAVFAGAFGHVYGNAPQWYFSADVVSGFADIEDLDWQDHLDDFGAGSLPVFAALVRKYPLQRLTPVLDNSVVRPLDSAATQEMIPTRYSSALTISYLHAAAPVAIELTKFAGDVAVTWISAETGERFPQNVPTSDEDRTFMPPGSGDWILVLDARGGVGE